MKIKIHAKPLLAGVILSSWLSGCTLSKVSYENAPLTPVKFASPAAAQTFYNALLVEHYPPHGQEEKNETSYQASLNLVMPFWFEHKTQKAAHVLLNEAVAKADADRDGVITESEAQAYAATLLAAAGTP